MSAQILVHPRADMGKQAAIKVEGDFAAAITKYCDVMLEYMNAADIPLPSLSHPELLKPVTRHMYDEMREHFSEFKAHLAGMAELQERVRMTRNLARYRAALARRSLGEDVAI